MKAPCIARVIAAFLCVIICCGCVHDRYMSLVGPLEKVGIVRADNSRVRLVAFDLETGGTLGDFKLTILSKHGSRVIESDADGNIDVPISADLRDEDPEIVSSRRNVGIAPAGYLYKTYGEFIQLFETSGAITPDVTRLRVQVTKPHDKKPIEGLRLAVLSRNTPALIASDSRGMLLVPISEGLRRENPLVVTNYRGPMTFYYCGPGNWSVGGQGLGATIRGIIENRPLEVSTKGMWQTITGDLTIWYCPEYAAQARKAEDILTRQYDAILNATGFKPVKWGIIIHPGAQDDMPCVVSCAESGYATWCYSAAEVDNGRFAQINSHEWAEATIDDQLRLYHCDRSNRFVGDGLAEYVSSLCVKATGSPFARADEVADYLQWMRDSGVQSVNLLKDFRSLWVLFPTQSNILTAVRKDGRLEGYGLSLAFWNRLVRKHGNDLPRNFLARLEETDKHDSTAAIKVLQDLTGERDIRKRLTAANIGDAINELRSMAPANGESDAPESQGSRITG